MTYGTMSDSFPVRSRLRDFLARHALRATGLAVAVFAALLVASLVTWHVDDPSFSYATDGPVRNLLGWPGAAFADLAMQFLGVAVVGLVFPLAILGCNLFRLRLPRRSLRQLLSWLGGALLFSAALASLPVPAQWPLPTGLGGAAGDLLLGLAEWLGGGTLSAGLYAALAVVLGGLSLGLLWAACLSAPAEALASKRPPKRWEERDEEEDEGNDSAGRLRLLAGILAHWTLTLRAMIRRQLARRAAGVSRVLTAVTPALRREPSFAPRGDAEPNEDGEFDEAFAAVIESEIAPIRKVARRVQPATPRPKPSTRIKKEAQPSLLPAEEFELPPLHLLLEPKQRRRDAAVDHGALEQNARLLEGVLEDFGVRGEIINVRPGPVVTLYELEPAPGIKSSRVISLADDIARSMSAVSARVAVIPGRNVIGIELPNMSREVVYLRELLGAADYESSKAKLALTLGKTIGGEPVIADLAKMPHLLMAGTTGSGKSVSINPHDPVAALPADARTVPDDHDRSEDAGAVGL
jgi:S-DNA-T family DNA segregation ATPase FtsK/SpoIIIE